MRRRRVKITGVGPVTPAGIGREAFWKGILEPVSRVRAFRDLGKRYGPFVAACVDDFDLRKYLENPRSLLGEARHTQFGLAGAVLALADAGIPRVELEKKLVAVFVGASLMDCESILRSTKSVWENGGSGGFRRTIYVANIARISGVIVSHLGLNATTVAPQSSCCSGLDAIGAAADAIANGLVDISLCGGVDAPLFPSPLVEMRAINLTPKSDERPGEVSRPFDQWRATGVVGEGAAIIVLEPEESPRPALAWVDGYQSRADREELMSGLTQACEEAIVEAGLTRDEIEVLNLWGPGHRLIDKAEGEVMRRVFGERMENIAAGSIKGAIGNPLAAAGAIQIVSSALGLAEGIIPPTVNWRYPDPACPFCLAAEPRFLQHQNVIVNAHGLSGENSCIVLKQ